MEDFTGFNDEKSNFLRLDKNIPTRFTEPIRTGILKFFSNLPNFDIRNTSVATAATSDGAVVGIQKESVPAVIDGLCKMQRTLAFASTLGEFQALVNSDLTSAFKIASMPVGQLMAKIDTGNPATGYRATGSSMLDNRIFIHSKPAAQAIHDRETGSSKIDNRTFILSKPAAQAIHDRATAISDRNQSVLTSMYQNVRGTGITAIDGPVSEKGRLNILGSVGGNTVKNINLEELFGAMDSDPCDDCKSVTSPVAYFVEILQFLRNNNLDSELAKPNQETVLDHLFARRPDLGDLQLTCPNTTAVLPYIDLANEVMESFVVHLDEQTPGDAERIGKVKLDVCNSDDTSGELLSEPQHTNFGAYSILSTKLYPFHKLPYNQALNEARTFLKYLGTSRYELLENCYPRPSTPNRTEFDSGNAAMIAEYLNLSHEEYSALTGTSCGKGGPKMEKEREYWGYPRDTDLLSTDESTHIGLRFIKAQFLPRSGIQFSELVDLLKTEYINPMGNFAARNTIVILHHSEKDMRYRLIRSNGDSLQISDYQRIRQFIHLWHRIGWTIDEVDKAICGLSDTAEITPGVLGQLVAVLKLLKITKLEPSELLTFWSPISMQGADSLYSRLFLTSGATRADPVLQLDEYGYFLSSATISQHEPLVMATLGLTKEGLDIIRKHMYYIRKKHLESVFMNSGLDGMAKDEMYSNMTENEQDAIKKELEDNWGKGTGKNAITHKGQDLIGAMFKDDRLSINNLSFLYRYSLMAKFLGVTPMVLLEMINFFGNPFDSPASCLDFVELWKRMGDRGFTFAQLNYVVNGDDNPANPLALSEKKLTEIVESLLNGSAAHPKTADTGTNGPGSERDHIKTHLEKDLVFTIVSKALGLSMPITDALLSNLKDGEKKTLDIAKSFMKLELEKISQIASVKRAVAAVEKAIKHTEEAIGAAEHIDPAAANVVQFAKETKDAVAKVVNLAQEAIDAVTVKHAAETNGPAEPVDSTAKADECTKQATIAARQAVKKAKVLTAKAVEGAQEDKVAAAAAVRLAEAVKYAAAAAAAVNLPNAVQAKADQIEFISLFTLLSRASIFISGFKLSAAEVTSVLANSAGFEGFKGNHLSQEGWKRLLAYSELRDCLPKGVHGTLLDLLQWLPKANTVVDKLAETEADKAREDSADQVARDSLEERDSRIERKIAGLMLIKEGTVKSLIRHFGPPDSIFSGAVTVLTKLKKACDFAKKLAIDVDSLLSWAPPGEKFQHTHEIAQEIRASIRARFTKEDWGKMVKPLEDQLRQNKRDALIAYLLVQPKLIRWGVIDADSLFEFFMIDVQMGPCFETSRIKQAISTVQVFVQRCFCGLEERYGVSNHSLDQKRWEWMKNYRMWEANRKVFLYPENWIEPSLRDDKSPVFLEFEADLVKKDLDQKSMEDAVKNYISRVHAVSRLLPVALWVEKTDEVKGAPKTEVVHLFARTRSAPYVYYYRPYDAEKSQWKPWEQMDVDIQHHHDPDASNDGGSFLIPTVIGGRLIIFTPQIVKQVKQVKKGEGDLDLEKKLDTVEYFEIKLGWSEYRNGKWTPKQLSSQATCWISRAEFEYTGKSKGITETPRLSNGDKENIKRDICHFQFSVSDHKPTEAKITVLYGKTIQTFSFDGTSCSVNGDETRGAMGTQIVEPEEWAEMSKENKFSHRSKFNISKTPPAATSSKWTFSIDSANLSLPNSPHDFRLYHDQSTSIITHTNASATLDDVYAHLDTPAKQPTTSTEAIPLTIKIPLNELETPFGLYDWELGLHAPMLLMDKLTSSQQYDKALEIAHFVFNPMASGEVDSTLLRVWNWAPFREISARRSFQRMLSIGFASVDQVDPKRRTALARILDNQLRQTLDERCKTVLKLFCRIWEWGQEKARYDDWRKYGGGDEYGVGDDTYAISIKDPWDEIVKCNTFGDFKNLTDGPLYMKSSPQLTRSLAAGGQLVTMRRNDLKKIISVVCNTMTEDQSRSIVEQILSKFVFPWPEEGLIKAVHEILDPHLLATLAITKALEPSSSDKDISEFLRDLKANTFNKKVDKWRNSKFQPHDVARGRPVAYMTWLVMRYIKILIAAGDQLFRRATMESMPLAIQYYTMAAHLYGPPIQEIPKHTKTTPKTFNTLINQWDAFSNAMVTFENAFPFTNSVGLKEVTDHPGFTMGYFCVPRNPAIRDLRTQIDDRLFKIRHSQDINGVTRKLALWEPPIDPGVFVRAAAAGLSLSSVMNSISGPMPNYRFQYLLRGAHELVQELKSLAGAFLSAKEKMDSEAYQRIRAGHESTINAMLLDMKKLTRDEAISAKESLQRSREGPLCRLNHILELIGEKKKKISEEFTPVDCTIEKPTGNLRLIYSEHAETTLSDVAAGLRSGATALAGSSELTRVIPTPQEQVTPMGVGVSVKVGPKNIAKGIRGASLLMEVSAQVNQHLSDSAARINSFTRQYQDRVLQANSAGHELNSINTQIKTQEVRVKIVEKDIELQEKQIETAKATEEFLHSKYTNEALYSWQETQLRTLHYQTYIVAYDLAKKVEKSYHFERGLTGTDANFIVGGWDDSKDGLLSAEALGLGLRRLEAAYQENRGHDFEITKHISLRQIDPNALLNLRGTNSCTFSLSQTLFDIDFPGHHMRRLKSVSLSLPCVVGPYTSVNSTLRLAKHSYQLTATGNTTEKEVNYVPIKSVAFSSGQNDPGVFELNFHDERYLPFEGAGAISTWDLSLPRFRAFDYNTISDVILHLRYTSIAGGTNASGSMNKRGGAGDELYASFDLRNEFASTWQQLGCDKLMTLRNLKDRLPWWTTNYTITVKKIELRTANKTQFEFQIYKDKDGEELLATAVVSGGVATFTPNIGITDFGTWYLKKTNGGPAPPDLWMLVKYTAIVKPQE